MHPTSPAKLIERHGIISNQVEARELKTILDELQKVLEQNTTGAVVEFGCYVGTTSLYIRRLLDMSEQPHEFHVYDSFAGLPEKTSPDYSPAGEQFKAGELLTSKKELILNFRRAGLNLPRIHKAWFNELSPEEVPANIVFAFLDGDYYDSIIDSLTLIWPKLTPGAVIVVDDYMNEALPGAQKAVDGWVKNHPAKLVTRHSLAIIHTQVSLGLF